MQAYVVHYLRKKHLQKRNNSRRVYGKKITRKRAKMEMKYSTKLQKKYIQKKSRRLRLSATMRQAKNCLRFIKKFQQKENYVELLVESLS